MKSDHDFRKGQSLWQRTAWLVLLAITAGPPAIQPLEAATNVVIWDTSSPFTDAVNIADRTGWRAVPRELLTLEADPPKAASDPGYYGRDYTFQGDAVVENRRLVAVFWAARGRVVIYAKAEAPGDQAGREILQLAPFQSATAPAKIHHCELLRNAGDEVALGIFFSGQGSAEASAVFTFGKTEIVEIKPAERMKGITLLSQVEYGVVPGFVGDDLIFGPADYPAANTLCLPSENLFLGLEKGEDSMLVMTWPKGTQQIKLRPSQGAEGKRRIEAIDFDPGGQSFYLAGLSAPGIWHREELKPSFLEKDVAIQWRRPFPARWTTQLDEAGVRTTFAFRECKGQVWRGVPGSYSYPVWFDGDNAFYHLSKKVPPKGGSLIYFLEGQDTPLSVTTPVDILKATLGRSASEPMLDIAGRKLRTHHRRGGEGVRRACTCGCTEAIQAIFEAGEEVAKKEQIDGALADMIYFVKSHVSRIDEYRQFADETIQFLQAKGNSAPELKLFLESLEPIAQQIPQEYSVQKENMKSLEYADELTRQTMALTRRKEPNNLKAYMDLLKAWRTMGGAQDYVVAQCHAITRKLAQQAGYGCVSEPKAVAVAEEIRRRCKQTLRNADGYEIWAEY